MGPLQYPISAIHIHAVAVTLKPGTHYPSSRAGTCVHSPCSQV